MRDRRREGERVLRANIDAEEGHSAGKEIACDADEFDLIFVPQATESKQDIAGAELQSWLLIKNDLHLREN